MAGWQTYRRTAVCLIGSALGLVAAIIGFTVAGAVGHSTQRSALTTYQAIRNGAVQPVTGTVHGDVYDLYTTSAQEKPCASQDATMQNFATVMSDTAVPAITVDGRHFNLVAQLQSKNGALADAGLPAQGPDEPIVISCHSGINFAVLESQLNSALAARRRPYQTLGGFGVAVFGIFGMVAWRVGLSEHRAVSAPTQGVN